MQKYPYLRGRTPNCYRINIMHIYKEFSRHSLADYLDTYSELAVFLLAKITHLLTHSFKIPNDNGFQFHGHSLGCRCTNGNVRVVVCLFYPSTSCIIEDHIDIIPSMDIDVQLLTNLVIMIEKTHLGCSIQHRCCNQLMETPV